MCKKIDTVTVIKKINIKYAETDFCFDTYKSRTELKAMPILSVFIDCVNL